MLAQITHVCVTVTENKNKILKSLATFTKTKNSLPLKTKRIMTPKQFITKNWNSSNFEERVLPYLTNIYSSEVYKSFKLPKPMNDFELQEKGKPIPCEIFASTIQKFCETASKNDWYIIYVQTPKGVVAVFLYWNDDEWCFHARSLDDYTWYEGGLFLSFATDTFETPQTLSNLDTLTLEKAIQICKDNGLTITKTY